MVINISVIFLNNLHALLKPNKFRGYSFDILENIYLSCSRLRYNFKRTKPCPRHIGCCDIFANITLFLNYKLFTYVFIVLSSFIGSVTGFSPSLRILSFQVWSSKYFRSTLKQYFSFQNLSRIFHDPKEYNIFAVWKSSCEHR